MNTESLPFGSVKECKKCGEQFDKPYREFQEGYFYLNSTNKSIFVESKLHCSCPSCLYQWTEKCKDQKE